MPLVIYHDTPGEQQRRLQKIADTQRQVIRARRVVTPQMAYNAATIASAYPHMDAGQVSGLALSGQELGSPVVDAVSERQMMQTQVSDVQAPAGEGWFDNFVYDPFKGIIRHAFTLLNAGIEEVESAGVRAPIAAGQGASSGVEGNALAQAGRSDAWHAMTEAFGGGDAFGQGINLGEGFFPNSTVTDRTQANLAQGMTLSDAMAGDAEQMALGTPITVQGTMDRERLKITHRSGKSVPISFGRAAAINFTEPGTRSFQYLSGFGDAFKQIALDPADLLLGGAGKVRKLSKVVGNAGEANALSRAARGAMLGDSRKSFFSTGWDEYLNSAQGSHFVQRIAGQTGEGGYRQIHDLYRGTQGKVNPAHIRQLTDETDPAKVAQLIKKLGKDQAGDFKKFGRVGIGGMESSGVALGKTEQMTGLFGSKARLSAGGPGTAAGFARSLPAMAIAAGASPAFGKKISTVRDMTKAFDIPMGDMVSDAYETGLGFAIRQNSVGTYLGRLAASTASKSVNVHDSVQAGESLNQYFRSLGLDDANYNRLMYKASDPMAAWDEAIADGDAGYDLFAHYFGVLKDANRVWADTVRGSGDNISDEALDSIGNMFDSHDAMRAFWTNNAGDDMLFGGSRVTYLANGEAKALPSAVIFSQFMDQNIPLMDMGKVRSLQRRAWWANKAKSDKVKKLFGADDMEKIGNNAVIGAANFATNKLWKPAVLLRIAWPVRVIGEEQFRLSGAMLSGAFNHPMQFMTLMLTKDSRLLGKFARMDNDALGRAFIDAAQHDSAMSKSLANVRGGSRGARWESVNKTDISRRKAAEAHVNTVNQLRNDELTVHIAQRIHETVTEGGDMSLREIKQAFWDGELEWMRRNLVQDSSRWEIMNIRADADSYIDTVYANLVHGSGGRGKMLNRYDNTWSDFDGNTIPASEVFRGDIVPDIEMSPEALDFQTKFRNIGNDAAEAVEDGVIRIEDIAEGTANDIFDALPPDMSDEMAGDVLYDLQESLMGASTREEVEAIMSEVEQRMFVSTQRNDFTPQTGQRELIPSQEVLEGEAGLRTGDNRTVNRSMKGQGNQKLDDQRDMSLNNANKLFRDSMDGGVVEDLKNIGPDEFRTYSMEFGGDVAFDEFGDVIDLDRMDMTTISFGAGGQPVAVMNWKKMPNGTFQVNFMGGKDNHGIEALMKYLRDSGDISDADALKMYVGNERLIDWFRRSAENSGADFPDSVTNYEQLHAWIRANPDSMKLIDDGMDAGLVRSPATDMAATTGSGAGMRRQAVHPGKGDIPEGVVHQAARNVPQHDEYFKLDEMGDPRFIELIATGRIDADDFTWGDNAVNANTAKQFGERAAYFDDDAWFDTIPQYVRRPIDDASAETLGTWDKAVGFLMETLMSKPTNKLSRSPAFKQKYWQRMSVMYESADDEVRDLIRLQAVEAGLADDGILNLGKPVRAMRRAGGREVAMDEVIRRFDVQRTGEAEVLWEAGTNADVALREMDDIAKAYAVEEVKELLYDMANEHNWSEMASTVMPFGEAWWEVMSTWTKLMSENPRNLRRMQQGIQGARGSNPFQGVQREGPEGSEGYAFGSYAGEQGRGMFFRDPNTGDEMFTYPGSGVIANWMLGDAADGISFTGRVEGLSMMSQVMPGFGPMVQIPMSQMGWVNDPENRPFRDVILPFGKSPVSITNPASWLSPFIPTWMNKATAAVFDENAQGDQKRLFANTTMDVYKTLLMQGWSDNNEEDMKRTLDEAKRIAQRTYMIKTLASFAAPVGANELWEVGYDHADDSGELWAYQNMATAYRQLVEEFNGDDVQAYKKFTDLFGVDPMLFVTAKTQRVRPSAVTMEARRWEYDNADLHEADRFPNTAYFGQPDPVDGEFDYETYMLQLKDGTRQPLTPEQWSQRRNSMLGRVAFANFQRTADRRTWGNTAEKQAWLRTQNANLREFFPGYGREIVGLPATADLNTQLDELYRWRHEPRLNDSAAGQALADYLRTRDYIVRRWQSEFGATETGWRTGVNGALYRRQLKFKGEQLSGQVPDFLPLYNQILARELQEPEAGQQPIQLAGVTF